MGQCFGLSSRRRQVQRSNKRFEYTPKRSWKYRDDHIMSQFASLSREGREREEEEEDRVVLVESDDEEIDTGEIRDAGRLVFDEREGEEEEERGERGSATPGTAVGTTIINRDFEEDEESPGEIRPTIVLLPTSSSMDEELTLVSAITIT